jgi:hypothetical protein
MDGPPSLVVGDGLTTPHHKAISLSRNVIQGLRNGGLL